MSVIYDTAENSTPLRVALYARVSTDDQDPETQLVALRQFVKQRGWKPVGEFTDKGISGAKDKRPRLDAMLAEIRAGHVDVVCIWALDRLGRSLPHLVRLAEEFRQLEVDLACVMQPFDTTTPAGEFMFQTLGAVAQFERAMIADRVRAGVRRARAAGKAWGRRRVVTPELVAKARRLRDEEQRTWREIAMAVGTKVRTIRRALDEADGKVTRPPAVANTPVKKRRTESPPQKGKKTSG